MNILLISFILHFIYYTSSQKFKKTSSSSPLRRIAGGYPTNNVPDYYVGLILTGGALKEGPAPCGSTLISNKHVLTAAHLYESRTMKPPCQRYEAVLKYTNRCKGEYGEVVPIKDCHVHPKYTVSPMTNDIAILLLSRKVDYTPAMLPIINGAALRVTQLYNKQATISGYGILNEAAIGGAPCVLQMGEVNIMPHSICKNKNIGEYVEKQTMLCTASEHYNISSCGGDSGGGLIFDHGRRNIVIGITSFGIGCARNDTPSVYTYVPYYLPWIQSILKGPNSPQTRSHKKLKRRGPKTLPWTM